VLVTSTLKVINPDYKLPSVYLTSIVYMPIKEEGVKGVGSTKIFYEESMLKKEPGILDLTELIV
jgi:hypothetical protein